MEEDYLIKVKDLKEHFRINDDFIIKAVDGVSFGIKKNEIFGLVGESDVVNPHWPDVLRIFIILPLVKCIIRIDSFPVKKLIRKTWRYLKEKCSSFFRIQVLRLIRV